MEWIKLLRNGTVEILGVRIGFEKQYAKGVLSKQGYIVQEGSNCFSVENISIDDLNGINAVFSYNKMGYIKELNLNSVVNNSEKGLSIYKKFVTLFKHHGDYFSEVDKKEIIGNSFINNFSNTLIGVCVFLQYGIGDNKNAYPVSLTVNNIFDRKKTFSIDYVRNAIYDIYRNTSPIIEYFPEKKKVHKIKWKETIQILLCILLVVLIYVIFINGRYENLTNGYVLDKWNKEVYHVGTEEMPVRVNGTINNR